VSGADERLLILKAMAKDTTSEPVNFKERELEK